ncbi:MAG: ATP-binding protein [Zoogloeaceae bacterium]|jgi:hypothetical protein|nr:ATP-binding protein [Zoogloeaceae bacterium]
MNRKKLPIGIQTFAKIREDNYYYVDKTAFALKMIEEGTAYFLSRPRRFGKSLFLDTLAELFAGNEPLFRGLYCHDKWDWAIKYPVIRISFAEGVMASRAELDVRIGNILAENERRLGVPKGEGGIPDRFIALIQATEVRFGQRVAVLVDEYDKPILDNITTPDLAREMRDGLRNLYSVIKGQDAHIKFALLAGVSKFSKVNIFSGLNNLSDITLNAEYSSLCGYTDADVDTVFAPELEGLEREEIRHWYNGYNWRGESVHNPFDLLLLFDCREFRPFWFETGTPTFLVDMLIARHVFLPRLEHLEASAALLSSFDVGDISTEALLFQSGYLTIAGSQRYGAQIQYRLRFPNQEVRASFSEAMLLRLRPEPENAFRLFDLLRKQDFSGMEALIHALFAGIPADWYRKNDIDRYEGYYASVFYAFFASTGLEVFPEDSSHAGRLDMAVKFDGQVYLFEFKVVEDKAEGKALQQIKDKHYADKYRALDQPIHLIGVEFSKKERNLVGFEVETA